ncbi:hypothetical protein ACJX0J_012776, partial [Zea mays]
HLQKNPIISSLSFFPNTHVDTIMHASSLRRSMLQQQLESSSSDDDDERRFGPEFVFLFFYILYNTLFLLFNIFALEHNTPTTGLNRLHCNIIPQQHIMECSPVTAFQSTSSFIVILVDGNKKTCPDSEGKPLHPFSLMHKTSANIVSLIHFGPNEMKKQSGTNMGSVKERLFIFQSMANNNVYVIIIMPPEAMDKLLEKDK